MRPEHLVQASRDQQAGKTGNLAFKQAHDQAVADTIRFQQGIGLPSPKDDARRKLELEGRNLTVGA